MELGGEGGGPWLLAWGASLFGLRIGSLVECGKVWDGFRAMYYIWVDIRNASMDMGEGTCAIHGVRSRARNRSYWVE